MYTSRETAPATAPFLTPGRTKVLVLALFGLWLNAQLVLPIICMLAMFYAIIRTYAPPVEQKPEAPQPAAQTAAAPSPGRRRQLLSQHVRPDGSTQPSPADRRPGFAPGSTTSAALFGGSAAAFVAPTATAAPAARSPRFDPQRVDRRVSPAATATAHPALAPTNRNTRPKRRWALSFWTPVRAALERVHPQAYPYLRALIGCMLTMFIFLALKSGTKAQTGMMTTLNILVPTAVLAIMTLPIMAPLLMGLTKIIRGMGFRRGWSDVSVGLLVALPFCAQTLLTSGRPGNASLVMAIGFASAGIVGGFEFWRAEGFPEARRSLAQLLGNIKDGFIQGLSR